MCVSEGRPTRYVGGQAGRSLHYFVLGVLCLKSVFAVVVLSAVRGPACTKPLTSNQPFTLRSLYIVYQTALFDMMVIGKKLSSAFILVLFLIRLSNSHATAPPPHLHAAACHQISQSAEQSRSPISEAHSLNPARTVCMVVAYALYRCSSWQPCLT
jgi:hypothetical protein